MQGHDLIAPGPADKYYRAMGADEERKGERIAKAMARAGLCSRREAEAWIAEGRVSVNGKTLASAALNVTPDDRIEVDGAALGTPEPARLWRYHKPEGLLVSHGDPHGRATVFENLPPDMPRVVSIGRLDLNSEGLLLLTNDGALARHLELPATGWTRRYRVRVFGDPDPDALARLKQGVTVEGVRYGPVSAVLERRQGGNAWLAFALKEGKNREVKRLCEHLGLKVNRLIRVAFGPFQLGDLARGSLEEVQPKVLKEQVGARFGNPPGGHAGRRR